MTELKRRVLSFMKPQIKEQFKKMEKFVNNASEIQTIIENFEKE